MRQPCLSPEKSYDLKCRLLRHYSALELTRRVEPVHKVSRQEKSYTRTYARTHTQRRKCTRISHPRRLHLPVQCSGFASTLVGVPSGVFPAIFDVTELTAHPRSPSLLTPNMLDLLSFAAAVAPVAPGPEEASAAGSMAWEWSFSRRSPSSMHRNVFSRTVCS